MGRCLGGVVLVALLLVRWTLAQELPKQEQPAEPTEETTVYQPPPAWKSVEIGNYYLIKKDYPGAMSRFKEAVATDPHYPDGYLGAGKVYDKIGFPEKALDAYRKYLDLLPSTKDALEAKDVQKAVSRLEKVVTKAKRTSSKAPASRQ